MLSVVAKEEVKNYLFLGSFLKKCDALFIKRNSSKGSEPTNPLLVGNESTKEQINERITKGLLTDDHDPLFIFPEGGTTNGKYLIKFKRGAFSSLNPV